MTVVASTPSLCALVVLLLSAATPRTGALEPIFLPSPDFKHSSPLLQTLKERKSTKAFDTRPIPRETLSTLLWAAFGINRPDSGKRTVATASNCQDIDIYVVFAHGVYVYQAKDHRLVPVLAQDVRSLAATQTYAQRAPVNLVYVSELQQNG